MKERIDLFVHHLKTRTPIDNSTLPYIYYTVLEMQQNGDRFTGLNTTVATSSAEFLPS